MNCEDESATRIGDRAGRVGADRHLCRQAPDSAGLVRHEAARVHAAASRVSDRERVKRLKGRVRALRGRRGARQGVRWAVRSSRFHQLNARDSAAREMEHRARRPRHYLRQNIA